MVSGNSGEPEGSDGRALSLGQCLYDIRRDGTLTHDAGLGGSHVNDGRRLARGRGASRKREIRRLSDTPLDIIRSRRRRHTMRVSARNGKRTHLAGKRTNEGRVGHAQGHRAVLTAKLGRHRPARADHERKGTGPETLRQMTRPRRNIYREAIKLLWVCHEQRKRLRKIAALDVEDAAMTGVAGYRGGTDAIDGVRRHDDDPAGAKYGGSILNYLGRRLALIARFNAALRKVLGLSHGKLTLENGNEETGAARKVMANLNALPAALGTREIRRRTEALLVKLDGEHAARHEGARREVKQAAVNIEAVHAASKRELGLEIRNLRRKLAHHLVRNVGRIRDEDGERAHEPLGHAGGEVAFHDVNCIRKAKGIAILAGKAGGDGRNIRRSNASARAFACDGTAHAARSTTNLEYAELGRRSRGVNALEGGVDQKLGLRAGDKDAGRASDLDEAEARLARNVLERLSLGATGNEPMHEVELGGIEWLVIGHVETRAVLARRGTKQPLRGEASVVIPLGRKVITGPLEAALDGPDVLLGHGSSRFVTLGRHVAAPRGVCRINTNRKEGAASKSDKQRTPFANELKADAPRLER